LDNKDDNLSRVVLSDNNCFLLFLHERFSFPYLLYLTVLGLCGIFSTFNYSPNVRLFLLFLEVFLLLLLLLFKALLLLLLLLFNVLLLEFSDELLADEEYNIEKFLLAI
jgi:hypothetical protein